METHTHLRSLILFLYLLRILQRRKLHLLARLMNSQSPFPKIVVDTSVENVVSFFDASDSRNKRLRDVVNEII